LWEGDKVQSTSSADLSVIYSTLEEIIMPDYKEKKAFPEKYGQAMTL
jgi:hypothetical protein